MPDWTYHPAYRPLVFRLPAEDARRLTMWLLQVQSKTRIGREIFRLLSVGLADEPVELFGLRFACRFGLGPGIDTDARAFGVLQFLGCGFLTAGPVTLQGQQRSRANDGFRIPSNHALVRSSNCYSPSAASIRQRLLKKDILKVPVGVVIDDDDPVSVIRELSERVDFFSLRGRARNAISVVRATTAKPIFLRIPLGQSLDAVVREATLAKEAGLDAVVIGDGEPYEGIRDGWIDADASLTRIIETVTEIHNVFGPELPVVASGSVITPANALECVEAGASLVEIASGFVYSGPGLIGRVFKERLTARSGPSSQPTQSDSIRGNAARLIVQSWALLAFAVGLSLLFVPARVLGGLANNAPYLISGKALATRAITASVLLLFGVLGTTIFAFVKRDHWWTSWLFALTVSFTLPISIVLATLGLAAVIAGDILSRAWLRKGFRQLFAQSIPAWRWSAANLGKKTLQFGAIMSAIVVMSSKYPGVVRMSFGGLVLCFCWLIQRGLLPGVRPLWLESFLCSLGFSAIALTSALGGPAWRMAVSSLSVLFMLAGIVWLWGPLIKLDEGAERFPDV